MGIEGPIASADERAASTLIDEACALTGTDTGNRVPPKDLARRLFDRVAPEDLERYSPAELARLAADTWDFLAMRPPGGPKLRLTSPPPSAGERLKDRKSTRLN